MSATIKITRKKLFDDLWELGYERSAEKYDVSLNELLQVYKDNNIPKPYESYFADKRTGKTLQIPELPGDENEEVELHCVWKRRKKVDSTLGSKANAICILQTLKDRSDENKALSVFDIIRLLEENYRLTVDRRTVYKTIELLRDLGYDIEVDKKGSKNYYALLEKTLDPSEVKIIMDSLMLNPLLSPKISYEINNKINKYLAKRTPLQRTCYWHSHDKFIEKYDTDNLLYSYLDEIDAALMQGKKLEFDYLKYDTNGNKVPYRDKKFVVSPYMIKIHNFTYYLLCSGDTDEEVAEFRIDRMTNVRMLDENSNGRRVAGKAGVVGAYNYG